VNQTDTTVFHPGYGCVTIRAKTVMKEYHSNKEDIRAIKIQNEDSDHINNSTVTREYHFNNRGCRAYWKECVINFKISLRVLH
jgi:hypothetical protein